MIKKGDFVQLDYVGRIKKTGEIFDLTEEELAKKEKLYSPKTKYGPITICVGEHQMVSGVDESLINKKAGDEYELEVPAEKAFGQRSAKLIQLVSASKFKDQKMPPFPGAQFVIDGMPAVVRSVSGGRVILDFNHPFSGKDLQYKVKIIKEVTDIKEQAEAVLSKVMPASAYSLEVKEKELTIKLKDKERMKPLHELIKTSLQRLIKDVKVQIE